MRIALFHNLPSGGAKRFLFEQTRELSRRGHAMWEFAPSTADSSFLPLTALVRGRRTYPFTPAPLLSRRVPGLTPYVHAVQGLLTLSRLRALCKSIAAEIDTFGFDAALASDCQFIFKPYVLPFLQTPSVFQLHHAVARHDERPGGGKPTMLGRAKRLYYAPARFLFDTRFARDEYRNARSARRVVVNSKFTQGQLLKSYGIASSVVYPGVDTELFRPRQRESARDYLLTVGALVPNKQHRFLVSALGRLPSTQRLPLRIVANSSDPEEERAVRRLASNLGVSVSVERITDDRALAAAYNAARVFLYAAVGEALGLAPLEAMACGVPVVAVGEGGVRETVLDGVTGRLVERDIDVFVNALAALLGNDAERRRAGSAGPAYVQEHWTWSQTADRMEEELRLTAAT